MVHYWVWDFPYCIFLKARYGGRLSWFPVGLTFLFIVEEININIIHLLLLQYHFCYLSMLLTRWFSCSSKISLFLNLEATWHSLLHKIEIFKVSIFQWSDEQNTAAASVILCLVALPAVTVDFWRWWSLSVTKKTPWWGCSQLLELLCIETLLDNEI